MALRELLQVQQLPSTHDQVTTDSAGAYRGQFASPPCSLPVMT
jgi:hypothetical protein